MDWNATATSVSAFVKAAMPVIDAAVSIAAPEAAVAVSIGEKIIQGVIAEEPTAMALYEQIAGGVPVTKDQVAKLEADYEAAYQQTKADIAAKLAAS